MYEAPYDQSESLNMTRTRVAFNAGPNRGVSKVALLRCSHEYVGKFYNRVDRRDFADGRLWMLAAGHRDCCACKCRYLQSRRR